jgi:beta-lactamase superfamily II metal-dependent hydrolase
MIDTSKMKIIVLLACALCACALPTERIDSKDVPVSRIPAPDGRLHIYALPIGQGAARVIQCPSGTLNIFDMGTSDDTSAGFWAANEIRNFLNGNFQRIRSIILTHNHFDHYSLLDNAILASDDLSGLTNIYVSCTYNEMVTDIKNWVNDIDALDKVTPFNGGSTCGSSGGPACGNIDLCPGDAGISTQVLSVNAGEQCTEGNKNVDSVVIGITYNSFKVQLNGDFEDFTESDNEDGPQKAMADFYGPDLQVDVYMIAHHGAENLANKPVILNGVAPRAVFVSANHEYSNFRHPRCFITDYFINNLQSLCKPGETSTSSPFYCGDHPISGLPLSSRLQSTFTCGPPEGGFRPIDDNEFAIFSTTPDSSSMNLIDLVSDGSRWGFVNNISPKIARDGVLPQPKHPDADLCFEE